MGDVRVFNGAESVKAAVGEHLGYSEWLEITQERVNTFAEATGDYQWIHIDVERAKAGPFGGTIAHGYLTLSLASFFLPQIATYEGFSMAINYGVDKVRFVAPVLVGKRIRAGAEMMEVTDVKGGIQTKVLITIEIEGSERPACVIESLYAVDVLMPADQQMGKGVNQRAKIQMSDDEIAEFLRGTHTMSLASLNADGTIHMVAMWYGFLEGEVAFETKAKSQKVANLRRNPTITCMVEDGTTYNELRGVQIIGRAEIFEERDRLLEMGKSLFERHVGPYTDEMLPTVEMMLNKRVGIKVQPLRVASWDHTKL